jgi:O-antigen/teichoic acid export membrane protein
MGRTETFLEFKSDRKTVLKNAFNSVLIQVIFRLKGIITMPIMTYYLLPREMGVFNLLIITVHLLTPVFSLNLISGPAVFMIQEKSRERVRAMFYTAFNSAVLASAACLISLAFFLQGWGGKYRPYLVLLLPMLASNLIYQLFSSILVNFQKTSFLVKISFFKDGATVLLTLGLVMARFSFTGMAAAVVCTDILASAYIYSSLRGDLPYRASVDKGLLKDFLRLSLPLLPVYLFNWMIQSSDSYFLAQLKGEAVVGKYSVIYGLSNVILIFTYALNLFWIPLSAKLWTEDKPAYVKAFRFVFAAFTLFLWIAVVLFEFDSKLIMRIMVRKPDYQDAYVIMGMIAFAFAMSVLITLLTAPLYSDQKPRLIFLSYLSGSVLNLTLNFALIPRYGIRGAALATAASYTLIVLVMSFSLYRFLEFRFLDRRLLYLGAGFAMIWPGAAALREILVTPQVVAVNIAFLFTMGFVIHAFVLRSEEKSYLVTVTREFLKKKERPD